MSIIKQLMEIIDIDVTREIDSIQGDNVPLYAQICEHQLMKTTKDNKFSDDIIKDFHNHLDVCSQCRNNPMGLCSIGSTLLQRVNNL